MLAAMRAMMDTKDGNDKIVTHKWIHLKGVAQTHLVSGAVSAVYLRPQS